MGQGPVRMCIVCRRRLPKSELVRFAKKDGNIVMDERGITPGRGAYCCSSEKCLQQLNADRKGLLKRALRIG